jgi:AraC family transcriptional regulator
VIAPHARTSFVRKGTLSGLSMHLSTHRLRDLLGEDQDPASCDIKTKLGFDDPFVWSVAHALANEIRDPSERGSLYADAMADALSLHLVRTAMSSLDPPRASRGFATLPFRRVRDRIEASLDSGISLADLAEEAGMSRHRFTRAFRKATGMAPHRYLTERRIERSKVLLRHSELPLVDIALSSGFASQSHFCDRFRASTGVSPGQYRRGE